MLFNYEKSFQNRSFEWLGKWKIFQLRVVMDCAFLIIIQICNLIKHSLHRKYIAHAAH